MNASGGDLRTLQLGGPPKPAGDGLDRYVCAGCGVTRFSIKPGAVAPLRGVVCRQCGSESWEREQ